MVRLAAALLIATLGLSAPVLADAGEGGFAGTRLLYDIDFDAFMDRRVAEQAEAVRAALETAPAIPYERLVTANVLVEVTLAGATEAQHADAAARLEPLRGRLPDGNHEFVLGISDGFVRFAYSDAGRAFRTRELIDQSIAAIGRRIARMDVEAVVRAQGDDRIVVTLGGRDAAAAQAAISRGDGFLALHVVFDPGAIPPRAMGPAGLLVVPDAVDPAITYVVEPRPALTFADIASARVATDPISRLPVVQFTLTPDGAETFALLTAANIGRRMAIVFDGVAISVPTIQGPILGGEGVITGNFDMAAAFELADAINAGGLPVPLELAEVRTIGEASPPVPPSADAAALAVELMFVEEGPLDPAEIVAAVRRLGLGKASVQLLDGGERSVVVTIALPPNGDDGRAKAVSLIRQVLDGRFLVRAYWRLGPVFVRDRMAGLMPG